MSQPRTQDNQKVANSAVQNFQSFVNGVKAPSSSSKNLTLIYENMTKLFDAFTQGALMGQGANSEILLRTVYRSLNDDFLQIVQDSKATDRILDLIKEKQDSVKETIQNNPEKIDDAMVSNTTKKVVTKTLDPIDYDPFEVAMDFSDELQNAILQVRLNLTREYERQKLAYAKSYRGQEEDFAKLNQAFQNQDQTMVNSLSNMKEESEEWRKEHLAETKELLDTFSKVDSGLNDTQGLTDLSDRLDSNERIASILNPSKFNPKKTIKNIKHSKPKVSDVRKPEVEEKKPQTPQKPKEPEILEPIEEGVEGETTEIELEPEETTVEGETTEEEPEVLESETEETDLEPVVQDKKEEITEEKPQEEVAEDIVEEEDLGSDKKIEKPEPVEQPKPEKPVLNQPKTEKPVEDSKVEHPDEQPKTQEPEASPVEDAAEEPVEKDAGKAIPIPSKEDAHKIMSAETPEKQEDELRKSYAKEALDGGITTPMPTEALKPMLQGEQWYEDGLANAEKFAEESRTGKAIQSLDGSSQQTDSLAQKVNEFGDSQSTKLTLNDIEPPKPEIEDIPPAAPDLPDFQEAPRPEEKEEQPEVEKPVVSVPVVETPKEIEEPKDEQIPVTEPEKTNEEESPKDDDLEQLAKQELTEEELPPIEFPDLDKEFERNEKEVDKVVNKEIKDETVTKEIELPKSEEIEKAQEEELKKGVEELEKDAVGKPEPEIEEPEIEQPNPEETVEETRIEQPKVEPPKVEQPKVELPSETPVAPEIPSSQSIPEGIPVPKTDGISTPSPTDIPSGGEAAGLESIAGSTPGGMGDIASAGGAGGGGKEAAVAAGIASLAGKVQEKTKSKKEVPSDEGEPQKPSTKELMSGLGDNIPTDVNSQKVDSLLGNIPSNADFSNFDEANQIEEPQESETPEEPNQNETVQQEDNVPGDESGEQNTEVPQFKAPEVPEAAEKQDTSLLSDIEQNMPSSSGMGDMGGGAGGLGGMGGAAGMAGGMGGAGGAGGAQAAAAMGGMGGAAGGADAAAAMGAMGGGAGGMDASAAMGAAGGMGGGGEAGAMAGLAGATGGMGGAGGGAAGAAGAAGGMGAAGAMGGGASSAPGIGGPGGGAGGIPGADKGGGLLGGTGDKGDAPAPKTDAKDAAKQQQEKERKEDEEQQGTKLQVKPKTKMKGMCVCPICGAQHLPGQHSHDGKGGGKPGAAGAAGGAGKGGKGGQPAPAGKGGDTKNKAGMMPAPPVNTNPMQRTAPNIDSPDKDKITKSGVTSTIGKIHTNVQALVKDNKFKENFVLKYPEIQKNMQGQMKKIGKDEEKISKDVGKVRKNLTTMSLQQKGKGLIGMIMNPMNWLFFGFLAIGAILLITLLRMALRKWADTYMPNTEGEGEGLTIFGFKVPFGVEIMNLITGIKNFVLVGLPNWWDRIKVWFYDIKEKLFGRKGAFKNLTETKNTIRKIILAWCIGQAKKAVSNIIVGIGWVLNFWFPGAYGISKVIAFIVPKLWGFIFTQLMLLWSNRKAASEQSLSDLQKNLTANEAMAKVKAMAKNVRPLVPMAAIPGLETPKDGKKSKRGYSGAIMRNVGATANRQYDRSEKIQENAAKEEMEKGEEADNKRFKGNINGSLLGKISSNDINGSANGDKESLKLARSKIYSRTILPQITKIDKYVEQLKKSKRFTNVTGPLYDPVYGWNKGYRVYKADLMSPIPMTPFEEIHNKADIPIGQLSRGSDEYIGIMPFTWMQNGVEFSAHPINFEIQRATKIREIWTDLWTAICTGHKLYGSHYNQEFIRSKVFPWYAKRWRETQYLTKGGYDDNVLYKDKFTKFLERFRAGEINDENNNLEGAMDKTNWLKVAAWVACPVGMLAATVGKAALQYAAKQAENLDRATSYGNLTTAEEEGGGVLGWFKSKAKNTFSRFNSLSELRKFRKLSFDGVNYGDVRDLMIDKGILGLFNDGTVSAPIVKANTIIDNLTGNGIGYSALDGSIEKQEELSHTFSANEDGIFHLMWQYFKREGITGFSLDDTYGLRNDKGAQAAFAQSLLEHFALNVIPQWNTVEDLLGKVIKANGDGTPLLEKNIAKLTEMISKKGILDHLVKYIRFPNIKTKIIDESNANWFQKLKIDYYKKELGITPFGEQKSFLRSLRGGGGWFFSRSEPTDFKSIEKKVARIKAKIDQEKAAIKFTGDVSYLNQLTEEYNRAQNQLVDAAKRESSNSTIVSKPGVPNPVIPVQKSPEQLKKEEEERKKKEEELKRLAEEKRKKEAEEKRKKEEADRKRAEEVAIAEAKIKAMEAIRKQEQNYETILEKMVATPDKVTDAELKSLGDDVKNLKQEAENRINQLPREQRELKLALIRGDKVSDKTFKELKDTAIGLHGSLQGYIEEVNQIPCGSIMAVQNQDVDRTTTVPMIDTDSIDLGGND